MHRRAGVHQYRWPDAIVALGAAVLTLGLAVWMVKATPEWATVQRYLLILPTSLVTYWFGRRAARPASAAGVLLISLILIAWADTFATEMSSFPVTP